MSEDPPDGAGRDAYDMASLRRRRRPKAESRHASRWEAGYGGRYQDPCETSLRKGRRSEEVRRRERSRRASTVTLEPAPLRPPVAHELGRFQQDRDACGEGNSDGENTSTPFAPTMSRRGPPITLQQLTELARAGNLGDSYGRHTSPARSRSVGDDSSEVSGCSSPMLAEPVGVPSGVLGEDDGSDSVSDEDSASACVMNVEEDDDSVPAPAAAPAGALFTTPAGGAISAEEQANWAALAAAVSDSESGESAEGVAETDGEAVSLETQLGSQPVEPKDAAGLPAAEQTAFAQTASGGATASKSDDSSSAVTVATATAAGAPSSSGHCVSSAVGTAATVSDASCANAAGASSSVFEKEASSSSSTAADAPILANAMNEETHSLAPTHVASAALAVTAATSTTSASPAVASLPVAAVPASDPTVAASPALAAVSAKLVSAAAGPTKSGVTSVASSKPVAHAGSAVTPTCSGAVAANVGASRVASSNAAGGASTTNVGRANDASIAKAASSSSGVKRSAPTDAGVAATSSSSSSSSSSSVAGCTVASSSSRLPSKKTKSDSSSQPSGLMKGWESLLQRSQKHPQYKSEYTKRFEVAGNTWRRPKAGSTRGRLVLGLDCEMVRSRDCPNALARVSVVDIGSMLLDVYVQHAACDVLDYRTAISGVEPKHLLPESGAVPFETAQDKVLQLLHPETILVGHALQNDLSSLRIIHPKVVDTALLFSVEGEGQWKKHRLHSLVSMMKTKVATLQTVCTDKAHDSRQDASWALELALYEASIYPMCTRPLKRESFPLKVLLSEIPVGSTQAELKAIFGRGTVSEVAFQLQDDHRYISSNIVDSNPKWLGNAVVTYSSQDERDAAMAALPRYVTVYTSPIREWVGRSDLARMESELTTHFLKFGRVRGCKTLRSEGANGYPLFKIECHPAAARAILTSNEAVRFPSSKSIIKMELGKDDPSRKRCVVPLGNGSFVAKIQ
eukprot:TRINITY_DN4132_c0_g1_i3.p1 TRINITY_DN4132_c0_g1~~TRINITY_DN4132_c0_g1_i3.p1  ORF type:complete len:1076 (-),score=211.51 TRINITY_DN4132_c0_g1_i3:190-3096(-)